MELRNAALDLIALTPGQLAMERLMHDLPLIAVLVVVVLVIAVAVIVRMRRK